MKKKIFKIFALLFALNWVFVFNVSAQSLPERTEDCENLYQWFQIKFDSGEETNAIEGLPTICTAQVGIQWAIDIMLLLAGSIAVIFIMIGGFRYLTSAGNEEQSEQGKKTLTTAVIGLVAIILAGVIVRIVATTLGTGSSKPTNSSITNQKQPEQSANNVNEQDIQTSPNNPR